MRSLAVVALMLVCSLAAWADDSDTTTVFLNKFETFVTDIEDNDSTINWEQCNAEYKAIRKEYGNAHKKLMNNDQRAQYNKLKARYIKQLSLKKVGKSIEDKASSISSAVRGTVDGIIGK